MGMYTEIYFCAELKELPEDVEKTIFWLIENEYCDGKKPDFLPSHEFFTSERFDFLLIGTSCYFPEVEKVIFKKCEYTKKYTLFFKSSIKNYDGEIEKFLDWIEPYIMHGSGIKDMYAYTIYEEAEEPIIYYLS